MEDEDKVVLTFREKIGVTMMTLGVSSLIFSVFVFLSWLLMPSISESEIDIIRVLLILTFAGIGLIQLSRLTVKE